MPVALTQINYTVDDRCCCVRVKKVKAPAGIPRDYSTVPTYMVDLEGEEVYTNKDAIMKVTAYMINKKTNKVTLSNSIYVCLNNIGSINLASAAG